VLYDVIPEYDVKRIQLFVVISEIEEFSFAQLHHVDSTLPIALTRGGMCTVERRAVDHQVTTPALDAASQCLS
jgi:hypothetical protein